MTEADILCIINILHIKRAIWLMKLKFPTAQFALCKILDFQQASS